MSGSALHPTPTPKARQTHCLLGRKGGNSADSSIAEERTLEMMLHVDHSLQMPKGSCDKELRRPITGGRGRPAKKASRPLRGGWVGWKRSKGGAAASNPAENSGRAKKNLRPAPVGPDDITTSQSGGCQFHVSVSLVGFTGPFHFREGGGASSSPASPAPPRVDREIDKRLSS